MDLSSCDGVVRPHASAVVSRARAQVQEQKGLDIVRRDWCALSKDAGRAVLSAVLSCRPCEEVVEDIHEHLRCARAASRPLGRSHAVAAAWVRGLPFPPCLPLSPESKRQRQSGVLVSSPGSLCAV